MGYLPVLRVKKFIWIFILSSFLFSDDLFIQNRSTVESVRSKHISLEDGLSQSVSYWILQDKKGFRQFVATWGGLKRYDVFVLFALSSVVLWLLWSKRILKKKVRDRTQFLEKVNLIAKSINAEMEFDDLIGAILRETQIIKGIEKASALVRDTDTDIFTFKTTSGWDIQQLEGIQMTLEEAEDRYIKNSTKFSGDEDIFIAKDSKKLPSDKKIHPDLISKTMLVTRIRCEGKTEAYLIFDNMEDENAFDDQDILLLKNLKEHFVYAFQKIRLIAQLKNTRSQLIQSDKLAALGFLVAGVAHEINNPASFTHTAVYNLQRDIENLKAFLVELAGNDADAEILAAFDERFSVLFNHLAILNEGTTRITKTVSDLRTFYRKEKEEMIPIKLLNGLQVTANLVKTHFKEQVEFVYDFQADPEIVGTASELNQVFMNVMINACQAIKEKQKVTGAMNGILNIQVLIEKDKAVIRFKDNGIGMTDEVRKKMFDPFFTTRSMGEGTGLGLFISNGIVRKHNGRFDVVSEEGKGTTVNLYLPLKSNTKN